MHSSHTPRVKICCISSVAEAHTAVRFGADAIGLVSHMPSGPGVIPDDLIAAIARVVPPPVATFLLTSSQDARAIADQVRAAQVNTIQLVDSVGLDVYDSLRVMLPGIKLVQVVHVNGEASLGEAKAVAAHVDAVLLDSGNPSLVIKELGGTGRVHDWSLSQRIREAIDIPLFLAGGLRADNVEDAMGGVGPFGLDVCSGVRTGGHLDEAKLSAFMEAVRTATSSIHNSPDKRPMPPEEPAS